VASSPSRRHNSDTSTFGCMPANTIRSFSAAGHFFHFPRWLIIGPPQGNILPSEEAVA
jgi:hypothetical protein